MSYRPITDMWLLARAKLKDGAKYYGAYLGGFPERARILIGASPQDSVLHVCGGMAKLYPYKNGFGINDKTLDLNPEVKPDYLQDATQPYPKGFRAILCDPPYTEGDAEHYTTGRANFPNQNIIVKNAIEALEGGGRVGIIHYIVLACPKNAKFVACVGIVCGFNNRIRVFSVFEKEREL